MPDQYEIIWVAGFLEGEGCFDAMHQTSPRIRVTTTDLDVIIKTAMILGCNNVVHVTRKTGNNKEAYYCSLNGASAIEWMTRIYPYMGERRKKKIEECIAVWKERDTWTGRRKQSFKEGPKLSSPNSVWRNPESRKVLNIA